MQNIAVIRLLEGRLAWYSPGASEEPRWLDNDIAREHLRGALAQRRVIPVFAAPGEEVRLLEHTIAAEEKKLLARSLPFALEEEVAADVEDLHFAFRLHGELQVAVGICTLEQMRRWETLLADYPGISLWIPEPLLLPWQREEWCVLLEGERALVRTGEHTGFAIERGLVGAALEAALDELDEPTAVVVYGQDQDADTALVPSTLRERVQWRAGNFQAALLVAGQPEDNLNLRQGDFAPRLPLAKWWRQGRTLAYLFAAAFVLQLAATWADYRKLEQENLSLRTAVEESYRRANPRGALVDAEKQLGQQLNALRGTGQSSGFVSLMDRVGGVISRDKNTSIATVNYNDKAGEMRLNIVAADYDAVERIRAGINDAGLEATMESSSAQGDKVRARLRVGERS